MKHLKLAIPIFDSTQSSIQTQINFINNENIKYQNSAGRYVSPSPAFRFPFPFPHLGVTYRRPQGVSHFHNLFHLLFLIHWALRIAVPRELSFPYPFSFPLGRYVSPSPRDFSSMSLLITRLGVTYRHPQHTQTQAQYKHKHNPILPNQNIPRQNKKPIL